MLETFSGISNLSSASHIELYISVINQHNNDDKCILMHLIWLEERISIDKLNERISTFKRIHFCRKVSSENHHESGNSATSEQYGICDGFSSTKTLFRNASMSNDSQTYTCCVLCKLLVTSDNMHIMYNRKRWIWTEYSNSCHKSRFIIRNKLSHIQNETQRVFSTAFRLFFRCFFSF